ncbi:hypothetical protein LY474_12090 [Myxococcus stipitatus]|uniref:hypothetical protein n=1 Tax=Myxococcus stipitatus TaxID=83455 RepID=UPI001F28736E|nr:hypothetical protein [Myxococcus stipitatus]MCE9668553.1 hypothetical protein [Myxococcus stipitatus]
MTVLKPLRVAVVLAVAAVLTGFAPAAPSSECEVFCYKHPITGELICTPPCP